MIWYGSVHTPCTYGLIDEWLCNAGFVDVARRDFRERCVDGLASLDNRKRESMFVEALKR